MNSEQTGFQGDQITGGTGDGISSEGGTGYQYLEYYRLNFFGEALTRLAWLKAGLTETISWTEDWIGGTIDWVHGSGGKDQ